MASFEISRDVVIAFAAILYLLSCARVAHYAGRTGRNAVKWFFICLFFTAVPAMIVFMSDYIRHSRAAEREARQRRLDRGQRRQGGPPAFCPHCQQLIVPEQVRRESGTPLCPHCGLAIDEATEA